MSYADAIAESRRRWADPANGRHLFEVLAPAADFLDRQGVGGNVYSQNGEDGLLAHLFGRIGVRHNWCFEVGASDGIRLSNTAALRDKGWHAVLIEGHPSNFPALLAHASDRVHCYPQKIGPDDLDRLLADAGAPWDLDLGVIDVDGQDWWIFRGMERFRPRVLLVEYADNNDPPPALGGTGQAGLNAILTMGRLKHYRPLARNATNVLFVDESISLI